MRSPGASVTGSVPLAGAAENIGSCEPRLVTVSGSGPGLVNDAVSCIESYAYANRKTSFSGDWSRPPWQDSWIDRCHSSSHDDPQRSKLRWPVLLKPEGENGTHARSQNLTSPVPSPPPLATIVNGPLAKTSSNPTGSPSLRTRTRWGALGLSLIHISEPT